MLPANNELERLKRQYVSSKLSYLVFYLKHLLTDTPDCVVIVISQVRYLLIVTIVIMIIIIIIIIITTVRQEQDVAPDPLPIQFICPVLFRSHSR